MTGSKSSQDSWCPVSGFFKYHMKGKRAAKRRLRVEALEHRLCLAASVGWDGPGLGSAALTYYIAPVPSSMGLSQQEVESGLETALNVWAAVADITFTQTSSPNRHNSIDFGFVSIDSDGSTLAQAYYPDDVNREPTAGDVEFDTGETWEIGNGEGGRAFDLVFVAVHEIGHSLGLEHSDAVGSIMRATISPSQAFQRLADADIEAIQSIYAAGTSLSLLSVAVDEQLIAENDLVTLSGSYFDVDWADSHVVTIDWGDGSAETEATVNELSETFEATHRYLDDGESGTDSVEYTITVQITDPDTGSSDTDTTAVTVENVAPRLFDLSVEPTEEGADAALTGLVSDPGSLDSFTIQIDWGDGSSEETFTYPAGTTEFQETHVYADDPGGTGKDEYTIMITVTDDDLGRYVGLATATITNAAPTVAFLDVPDSGWLGQTIALQTEITDPGVNDIHTLHWKVTHDGLPYTQGDGAYVAFIPTREGRYRITATVDDDDGDSGSAMATISVDGHLGTVDFITVDELSLPDGALHLVLVTAHPGILTVEVLASEAAGDVSFSLFDENPLEEEEPSPIALSVSVDGNQRIDHTTGALQTYYVQFEGTSSDFSLRVTNLVEQDGMSVSVSGTDNDDEFEFSAAAGREIVINGVRYEFSGDAVSEVAFDGGDGDDMAILQDSPGDETLEAWATVAVLSNSQEDYVADFTVRVAAFEVMHVYAKQDGYDTATLHDSEKNDKFKAVPEQGYAKMYGGAMYNRVKFFDVVEAYATEGTDLARFFDTSGDDLFEAQQDTSRMSGEGFDVRAHHFERVLAYASEGADAAVFADSALKDEFHAKPWKSELFDLATDGSVYKITARWFESVRADATNVEGASEDGGQDIAKIWPSAGTDLIEASDDWLRFYRQDDTFDLLYHVSGFETIRVRDTADGDDALALVEPLAFDLLLGEGWE